MMFLSLPFVILFTCCLILYYTVKGSYQKPVLLLTSCIFVGYFNIAYLLIAALIAAITFYWGRWIGMQEQENKRRRVFVGGNRLSRPVPRGIQVPQFHRGKHRRATRLVRRGLERSHHLCFLPVGNLVLYLPSTRLSY